VKVVHVNKKFHAPLERETLKNIAKWTGATMTSSQYCSNGLASSTQLWALVLQEFSSQCTTHPMSL
jgi:hypothetical protein